MSGETKYTRDTRRVYVEFDGEKHFTRIAGPSGDTVPVVGFALSSGEEAEANTTLFLAAPELLETAKAAMEAWINGNFVAEFRALQAAIAKATTP